MKATVSDDILGMIRGLQTLSWGKFSRCSERAIFVEEIYMKVVADQNSKIKLTNLKSIKANFLNPNFEQEKKKNQKFELKSH
jgi:hypothetical protein